MEQALSKTISPDWVAAACVSYQVYPRSYQDTPARHWRYSRGSSGGSITIAPRWVSDAYLGCPPVLQIADWLDFGYDVSDYAGCRSDVRQRCRIFDLKLVEAWPCERLQDIIDQVKSRHSVDQHAWFKESRSSREKTQRPTVCLGDPKTRRHRATNWLSISGGSGVGMELPRAAIPKHAQFLAFAAGTLNFP